MTTPRMPRAGILSRGDAIAMGAFMLAGAVIAVATVIASVVRVIEVLPGREVAVFAEFAGTSAEAPIGPGGALVPVVLDTAYVTAPELPGVAVAALVIGQVVLALTVVGVVGCLLVLAWNILRGRMFGKANTLLVATAGMTAVIGYALVPFFGNMGANAAFAAVSDQTFDNVVMSVDLFPLLLLVFVGALATTTFTVGARLQRDTEGLV